MGSSRSGGGRVRRRARVLAVLVVVFAPLVNDVRAVHAAPLPATAGAATGDAATQPPRPEVPEEPKQTLVAAHDDAEQRAALDRWQDRTAPAIVTTQTVAGVRDTLVVPPSTRTYDLAALAHRFPAAFTWLPGRRLLVRDSIVVAPGGHLLVDQATVSSLLLSSGPRGHVFIEGRGATLTFRGQLDHPLSISSFDPATGRPDPERRDGRAFIEIRGGSMKFDATNVSYLGYPSTGATSGVAWTAYDGRSAKGHARDTTFSHNYYGAFAAGGDGLRIDHSAFVANVLYGFDPHTATSNTIVKRSRADRNGRHGFMFSEGCSNNVVQDSSATGNRGVGFMIDDGTMNSGLGRPSNDNTFLRDVAVSNGWAGMVVEGGTGNTVQSSRTSGQQFGIWVRNQASQTQILDSRILDPAIAGIRLGPGLGETDILGNRIWGGPVGIRSDGGSATWLSGGVIAHTTKVALRLDGDQRSARFTKLTVVAAKGHQVEIGGQRVSVAQIAKVQTHPAAGASAKWSLETALHRLVFVLWALILLPTILTRLGARRRWRAAT